MYLNATKRKRFWKRASKFVIRINLLKISLRAAMRSNSNLFLAQKTNLHLKKFFETNFRVLWRLPRKIFAFLFFAICGFFFLHCPLFREGCGGRISRLSRLTSRSSISSIPSKILKIIGLFSSRSKASNTRPASHLWPTEGFKVARYRFQHWLVNWSLRVDAILRVTEASP